MAFEIVQMIDGIMATVYCDNIEDATMRLGLTVHGVETRTSLRFCLQGQPKFAGFIGPCYGGEVSGVPVIRYEDQAVYSELSQ